MKILACGRIQSHLWQRRACVLVLELAVAEAEGVHVESVALGDDEEFKAEGAGELGSGERQRWGS